MKCNKCNQEIPFTLKGETRNEQIYNLYKDGFTLRQIAGVFNITAQRVGAIIKWYENKISKEAKQKNNS